MTIDDLARYCRRDIYRSIQYSSILPSACKFTLGINYILAVLVGLCGIFTLNFALVGLSIAGYRLTARFHKSPLLAPLPSGRFASLPDITDDLEPEDRYCLNRMTRRAGRDPAYLRVLSNMTSMANTPSVSSNSMLNYLILPPRFFDLWQQAPRAAEAMIAHEMGHFAQGDADLYIEFRRYMRFMISRHIPLMLLLAIVAVAGAAIVIPKTAANSEQAVFEATVGLALWADAQAYSRYAAGVIIAASSMVLGLVATVVLSLLLAVAYRVLNYRSEAVCDRISVALTQHDGILAALNMLGPMKGRSFVSPSLTWRKRKAARLCELLQLQSAVVSPQVADDSPVRVGEINIFSLEANDFRAGPQRHYWLVIRGIVYASLLAITWIGELMRLYPNQRPALTSGRGTTPGC